MLRILEIAVEGVIIYLLYKFVVHFVIPVYRSTKKVRTQMKEMQARMNEQMQARQQQQYQQSSSDPYSNNNADANASRPAQGKAEEGEYIDYEEVR